MSICIQQTVTYVCCKANNYFVVFFIPPHVILFVSSLNLSIIVSTVTSFALIQVCLVQESRRSSSLWVRYEQEDDLGEECISEGKTKRTARSYNR